MTFLPIVERELRVASRRRGTYGMRVRIAGAATLAVAACFVDSLIEPSFPFEKSLYRGLSGLCMLYCLAAGRLMSADCLSREKREGTLGLLFLTDLKGFDVVLGKLAATSLDGFYGLLAVFPLLAIPLLAGGMTNGELWRTALVLVNTFLFSLAIGLFVSSVSRDEQKVMGANLGLLLLIIAFLPGINGLLIMADVVSGPVIPALFYSCPVYSLWECADTEYKTGAVNFWSSLGLTFILTLLLVLLSCRAAANSWQDKPVSPRLLKRKGIRRRRWWREGRVEIADSFRKQLLDLNAYFWLAARPYLKAKHVWIFMGLMGFWWVVTTVNFGSILEEVNFTMALMINFTLKFWIITEAGHQLAEDKKSGAFELLLSTPLTVREILSGQRLALRRQFLKPVLAAVAIELLLMVSFRHRGGAVQGCCIWLAGILMFLADVITVGWVAMLAALTTKSHGRATIKTVACILLLQWLLLGGVTVATPVCVFLLNPKPWSPGWAYYVCWWFGLGILVDVLFLLRARRRLQTSFRQFALEPLAARRRLAWLRDWRTGRPENKTAVGAKLRRLTVAAAILLAAAAGVVIYAVRALRVDLPKPVIVAISQNKQPLRVFSGHVGFLMILPDGTLWSWRRAGGIRPPQQVGTNQDWVQASVLDTRAVGVRSDGTLWTWDNDGEEPRQFGAEHDWAEACAGRDYWIARKRDGTLWWWGKNNIVELGNVSFVFGDTGSESGLSRDNPIQVDDHRDWKALSTTASGAAVLAVRADGSLWTWGYIDYLAAGVPFRFSNSQYPVQVCQESNWVGFNDGLRSGVRNQAGESWSFFPFTCLPGAEVTVVAIGHFVSSNAATAAFGYFFSTNWTGATFETRADGTLWATPDSWPPVNPTTAAPRRVGRRSDWISVWSDNQTMLGLTSDGTLWTWGVDFGQEWHFGFGERIGLLKALLLHLLGSTSQSGRYDFNTWMGYYPQKEPRPLIRLVGTNSAAASPR